MREGKAGMKGIRKGGRKGNVEMEREREMTGKKGTEKKEQRITE